MTHDIVVVGGAGVDYVVRGPELPRPGRPAAGDVFLRHAGGKGLNQAVAAARLGMSVLLISCIGAEADGDLVLETARAEGVDVAGVVRDGTARTAVTLINVDRQGRKQTASVAGAAAHLLPSHVEAHTAALREAAVVLVQLEIPQPTAGRALDIAFAGLGRAVLDAAPATAVDDDLLDATGVLLLNADEAAVVSGVPVHDRASAELAAESIRPRGPVIVIIGAPDGRLVAGEGVDTWLPNHPVTPVDLTGAGDAFAGALAVALAEGRSIVESATFAHAAAAHATTVLGGLASQPYREDIARLLESAPSLTSPPRPARRRTV